MQPLNRIFTNLVRQSGATPGEIAKAVDDLIEGRRKNPGWTTLPPPEFRIAEAYMKYKIGKGKQYLATPAGHALPGFGLD